MEQGEKAYNLSQTSVENIEGFVGMADQPGDDLRVFDSEDIENGEVGDEHESRPHSEYEDERHVPGRTVEQVEDVETDERAEKKG